MNIKEQIKAEIERRLKEDYCGNDEQDITAQGVCCSLISFLDTLEEEPVKEYLDTSMEKVRLEMEIATYLKDWEEDEEIGLHLSTDNGCISIELDDVRDIARHFYNLGRQSECVKVKAESALDKFMFENCTHCLIEHCPGVKACYTSSNKQLQ